jgi:hypothetical protein
MAREHGRFGGMYVGLAGSNAAAEPLAFARKWTANFNTDAQEATAFGDDNKVYVTGLPDAQGTFEGFYDTATAQTFTAATDGLERRCYFYPTTPSNTGPYWYGTAFFDFSIETDVAGVVTVSGNWRAASSFTKIG